LPSDEARPIDGLSWTTLRVEGRLVAEWVSVLERECWSALFFRDVLQMTAWILCVATIVLAVALPCSRPVYATSVDEQLAAASSQPAAEPKPRKTLLEWPGHPRSDDEEAEGYEHVDPDRPHLPEASTAVGKGRIVLESGYTFTQKGSSFTSQSYPEALLRVGLFTDWFEVRIGQNFLNREASVAGVRTSVHGAQDLYLGVKLALVQQQQYLPQIALIPQMTVPTGSGAVGAGKVLPGLNVDCAWEVIKPRFGIELLIATNRVQDDAHRASVELATGLTAVFSLTPKLETFVEWDAFSPVAATGGTTGMRHYAVGGFVYFITKDFEVDIRAGVGLNQRANDFLAGAGFAVRY
jgi:Putative MetA-pathway of phenol degradation